MTKDGKNGMLSSLGRPDRGSGSRVSPVALERESDLAACATETLARLAVDNAAVVTGPLATPETRGS